MNWVALDAALREVWIPAIRESQAQTNALWEHAFAQNIAYVKGQQWHNFRTVYPSCIRLPEGI